MISFCVCSFVDLFFVSLHFIFFTNHIEFRKIRQQTSNSKIASTGCQTLVHFGHKLMSFSSLHLFFDSSTGIWILESFWESEKQNNKYGNHYENHRFGWNDSKIKMSLNTHVTLNHQFKIFSGKVYF